MKSTDNKIYFDPSSKREFIKIRDTGYDVYAFIDQEGKSHYVAGCVGVEFGWRCRDATSEGDKQLIHKIEKAKLKI